MYTLGKNPCPPDSVSVGRGSLSEDRQAFERQDHTEHEEQDDHGHEKDGSISK